MRHRAAISALVLCLAATAFADERGAAVLARARSVEAAQLAALAGTTLTMQTIGVAREGKRDHALSAIRMLSVGRDGAISNVFVAGRFDGNAVGEAELRKGTGAPPRPPGQAEALTVALAPLTASDVQATPLGPTGDGGYRLRCDVHRDAAIDRLELVVDEATGKKRAAELRPSSKLARLADRAQLTLRYADDGTPARLESHFAARVLWIDRAVDMTTLPIARSP